MAAGIASSSVMAQEQPPHEADSQQKQVSTVLPDHTGQADIIVAPVPFATPTSGLGVAVGAVALYNPNGTPHQWITGGGLVWAGSDVKGVAAIHSMSSRTDTFRLTAAVSYMMGASDYYGVGADDGDRNDALKLRNDQFSVKLNVLARAFPNGFLGFRYKLSSNNAEPDAGESGPLSATPPPPGDQLESTLSMIGPVIMYDTRDSHTQPTRGVQLSAVWLFGFEAIGDSFGHRKLLLEGHIYHRLSDRTVVAGSAAFCAAGGEVPYYDLCLFGAGADLRGYPTGRYRDRASWAVQGELRQQFTSRWGGAAFFGLGGIARSPGGFLDDGNLLPAGGVGIRYRLFKDNDANVRVDIARGKNDHGIYLGFAEAF